MPRTSDRRPRRPAPEASPHGLPPRDLAGAIWARLVRAEADDLSPDAARAILAITFGEADRDRMRVLVDRNRDDALSPEERSELDAYRQVAYLLDLMHSKARRSLARSQAG